MTIAAAWVRKIDQTEELVLACDSRLSGVGRFDSGPKILPLPRGDSAICFSGDTYLAYPVMLQIRNLIELNDLFSSRATDISDLKSIIIKSFNTMLKSWHSRPRGNSDDKFCLILCGYSWKLSRFCLWEMNYKSETDSYTLRTASRHWKRTFGDKIFIFTGDGVSDAVRRLYKKLDENGRLRESGIDMEPFEVIRDVIREGNCDTIGGPPQIMKIYKHMNCRPYSVFWGVGEGRHVTHLGRVLGKMERTKYLILDPDTLKTHHPYHHYNGDGSSGGRRNSFRNGDVDEPESRVEMI